MTLDDLKSKIRRELSIQKLINKDITSHIVITDADVTAFYKANKASFNLAEPRVHMAQILVTPNPEPGPGNLRNSKAQNDVEAVTRSAKSRSACGAVRSSAWSRIATPKTRSRRLTAAIWASSRSPRWRRPTSSCAGW